MPFRMFHEICPEISFRETRTITLLDNSGGDLPPDNYAFLRCIAVRRAVIAAGCTSRSWP